MGSRGPVPKRSDQRRRTNQDEGPIAKGPAARAVRPPSASREWQPLARDYFNSVKQSGQAEWYEPSDWQHLRVSCEVLSRMLESGRLSAQLYAAWAADSARLLVTEGDRRRMRLELERAPDVNPDADAGVASMDEWRGRLGAG